MGSEIIQLRVPTLWSRGEGNTCGGATVQVPARPGGVAGPGMRGRCTHGNRETSGCSPAAPSQGVGGGPEKPTRRTTGLHGPEESDGVIVPQNRSNNGAAAPAESGQGRAPARRNAWDEAAPRTQSRTGASSGLSRVRQRAKADRQARFTDPFRMPASPPDSRQEPSEVALHVRICAGGPGQPGFLPRSDAPLALPTRPGYLPRRAPGNAVCLALGPSTV